MKKNKKNSEFYWKKVLGTIILLFLCTGICVGAETDAQKLARLEAENNRLRSELEFKTNENAALRKELIETLDKYSTQAGILKRMQAGTAGTIETLEPVYMGTRAMELAADLNQTIEFLRKFSAYVLSFAEDLDSSASDLAKTPVEAVTLRLKLDPLRNMAREGARFTGPALTPEKFRQSRVLALDRKSQIAVLSDGYRSGVRVGMMLYSGKVGVKIIAVRSFVSAAVLAEGDFNELSIGKILSLERASGKSQGSPSGL